MQFYAHHPTVNHSLPTSNYGVDASNFFVTNVCTSFGPTSHTSFSVSCQKFTLLSDVIWSFTAFVPLPHFHQQFFQIIDVVTNVE